MTVQYEQRFGFVPLYYPELDRFQPLPLVWTSGRAYSGSQTWVYRLSSVDTEVARARQEFQSVMWISKVPSDQRIGVPTAFRCDFPGRGRRRGRRFVLEESVQQIVPYVSIICSVEP